MKSELSLSPLLLLHSEDNVFVARRALAEGETIVIDDRELRIATAIPLGHKVARYELIPGAVILKYGAGIGSATHHVRPGEHVHVHNMKSEYIPSHTRQTLESRS